MLCSYLIFVDYLLFGLLLLLVFFMIVGIGLELGCEVVLIDM